MVNYSKYHLNLFVVVVINLQLVVSHDLLISIEYANI